MWKIDLSLNNGKVPWRLVMEAILFLIVIIALLSVWHYWNKPPAQLLKTQYVTVPQEKIVEKIRTVAVPGPKQIITLEKPVVVEKLKLAEEIAKDDTKQVIANADIPASKAGISACAVMDTVTGVTTIIAKEKTLPFFAFENMKELGARYGLTTTGMQEGQVYGRWTFCRAGALYLGGYTELNSRAEAKGMLDLSYRW